MNYKYDSHIGIVEYAHRTSGLEYKVYTWRRYWFHKILNSYYIYPLKGPNEIWNSFKKPAKKKK